MFAESAFTIGGWMLLGLALLVAAGLLLYRIDGLLINLGATVAGLIGFGIFFLGVGRQAKTARRRLLESAAPGNHGVER